MAHNIESIAWTNEEPWHGLGTKVEDSLSVEDMMVKAQLNWKVDKRQVYFKDGEGSFKEQTGQYALVRDKDDLALSHCGSAYEPVQNESAFKFFKEFVEAGKAKMETAGSISNGQYVWGLANLQSSFKLRGNDEVKGYLLVAAPHVVGKAFVIKFTTVRVVCNNTLTLALKGNSASNVFRMHHRAQFDEPMMEKAKETLGIARDQMVDFEKTAIALQGLKLTEKDCVNILQPVYQPKTPIKELQADFDQYATITMKELILALNKAPGAQPDNGWGLLNAVTYHVDHLAAKSQGKRLQRAWFGDGEDKKQQVLASLLQLAA